MLRSGMKQMKLTSLIKEWTATQHSASKGEKGKQKQRCWAWDSCRQGDLTFLCCCLSGIAGNPSLNVSSCLTCESMRLLLQFSQFNLIQFSVAVCRRPISGGAFFYSRWLLFQAVSQFLWSLCVKVWLEVSQSTVSSAQKLVYKKTCCTPPRIQVVIASICLNSEDAL
jgi:hypothetical protein